MGLEHLVAGGAGQDQGRVPGRGQGFPDLAQDGLEALLPPGPPGRGPAAAQQQPEGAAEPAVQVGNEGLDLFRHGPRQLAAGEEHGGRPVPSGPETRRFRAAGLFHVQQGELVGGRGHEAPLHQFLAGGAAEVRHGEIVGAQGLAQSAEGAGVDQPVGLVDAADDGEVVVDLPRVDPGVALVSLEVGALADAVAALAAEAAACLLHGVFPGGKGLDVRGRDEKPGFPGKFLLPPGSERGLLEEAVDGVGRPFPVRGLA